MPNQEILDNLDKIGIAALRIIRQSRPLGRRYNKDTVLHFMNFIKLTAKHDVLKPIDICIGLYYIEKIFEALMIAKAANAQNIWIQNYEISVSFHLLDELVCVVAMALANKGMIGEDVPFNNNSFQQCYASGYPIPYNLKAFNNIEIIILRLLKFDLTRDPAAINRYAQAIFIPQPIYPDKPEKAMDTDPDMADYVVVPHDLDTEASLIDSPATPLLPTNFEAMKTAAAKAFPYAPHQKIIDDAEEYHHRAYANPTCIEDILPAQFCACMIMQEEPPEDKLGENAIKWAVKLQELTPEDRRALVVEDRKKLPQTQQDAIIQEELAHPTPHNTGRKRTYFFAEPRQTAQSQNTNRPPSPWSP